MKQNTHIVELIGRIGVDANAASELLSIAAELIENGKPLPAALAKFLAASIRRAMEQPSADRATALVFELGLIAPAKEGRPRKATPNGEIAATVAIFGNQVSEGALKRELNLAYGLKEGTARSRVKDAKRKVAEAKALKIGERK